MRIYFFSVAVGIFVGVIYGVLNVRSPAPPVVALVGLLGILMGEQVVPVVKASWRQEPAVMSWLHQIKPHVFGELPAGRKQASPRLTGSENEIAREPS